MKKITTLFSLILLCAVSFAQTQYTMGISPSDITTCDAYIYDNGGENGNYGTGRDDWMTIHPTSGAVTIRFMEFDVANTDTLYIYNGTDPNNDSIPLLIGSLATFWVNESNVIQVGDQEASATIQNPTGALTLHFVSSASSETRSGFALLVSCQEPCQRLHANIDFANSYPAPHFDAELNDGYYYIDFCPGDTIHLVTTVSYPDNDYSYHQDMTTTYFDWSHGNSGNGMNTLDYLFNPGQGYDLTMSVRDSHNGNVCYGQTPVAIRIRGSQDPFVSARLLEDVCQGTEVPLLVSLSDTNANILVTNVGSTQESSLSVDSVVFIPDGPNCPVQCYSSAVNFTAFPPGATITSAADILAVRLNIEHEFIGDINISLICPNSRQVLLLPDHCSSNQGSYFGEPMGYNSHHSYDGTPTCSESANPPGTGWNYCWSENSSYAQIASGYCYNHLAGGNFSSSIDSSNVANRTNYYRPQQSFSNLIGCPLNGLWQIQVCDTWSADNGYIFSWELALDPSLMPQDWTYNVDITGINWAGGNIVPTSDSTAAIVTDQPGDYDYTFTIVDEFGCQYDHIMQMKVVQQPEFTLTDQNICIGETATLDPDFNYQGVPGLIGYNWSNGETGSTLTSDVNGEYALTISCFNNDHSLACTYSDTANIVLNPQPVANFSASLLENCSPLVTTMTDQTTYTDGPHPEITLDYQWSVIDANDEVVLTSNNPSPEFTITDAGIYSVQLIVHTPDGCGDTLLMSDYLTVFPQPISDFLSNPERTNLGEGGDIFFINITDTTVFNVNDVVTWTWNYGDGGEETHETNGAHTYDSWGEFVVTLSVQTDQGCASTVNHTVYIEADLIFPNIMTPNGDGVNDVFAIKNMNPILPNRLDIYNRWGKKVYSKENYQAYIKDDILYNAEQGFNAESLSDGVYYFTFHYEGYTRGVDYHGSLTIIRD